MIKYDILKPVLKGAKKVQTYRRVCLPDLACLESIGKNFTKVRRLRPAV